MASDRQPNLAGPSRLFTAGASRTRRGRNTSRIALLLTLMLVAGALTIPALAKPVEPGIISPSPETGLEFDKTPETGETVEPLSLVAQASNGTKDVAWSLWIGDPGEPLGDGPGAEQDVAAKSESFDFKSGLLQVKVDFAALASSEDYYFVFEENPDDPDGPKYERYEVQFSIFDDMDTCTAASDSDDCEVKAGRDGGPSITAHATGSPKTTDGKSTLKLGLGDTGDDGVAAAVYSACTDELSGNERLAGSVSHLIPTGFSEGQNVTVQLLIPKESIDEGTDRGTNTFQVCVAPDGSEAALYEADYGQLDDLDNTDLVGPILLNDCENDDQTACIIGRERAGSADLLITYRIPAVDPWMM